MFYYYLFQLFLGELSPQNKAEPHLLPHYQITQNYYPLTAAYNGAKIKPDTSIAPFRLDSNGVDTSVFDSGMEALQGKMRKNLDLIEVNATRVGEESPIPHVVVDKKAIAANNVGVDLPFLLEQTPSVVATSDAGAGIGYTGLRIRGSDATRINVTINGIPVNDAESQGVFWVNMPDLASSAEDIQIQRGAGSSTNGAGAFGASVNIRLNRLKANPYAETSHSIGSFNSRRHNILFGTGLINGMFSLEARLSRLFSDGFIDRATSNLQAYAITASFVRKNTLIRFNLFGGKEVTYQSWGGVPVNYVDTNRTYNPYTYKNEVDNYQQPNYQLHFSQQMGKISANVSLFYTRGLGYFEQYRKGQEFGDYNLENITLGDTVITETDLIRRRWLDNHFYGTVFNATYADKLNNISFGGGANQYKGQHYGEIIWAQYSSNGTIGHRYYDNMATKNDINLYAKYSRVLNPNITAFADLQQRMVSYDFLGFDNDLNNVTQQASYSFFNPKLGANFKINPNARLYASFAVANKEPNRNDLTESSPNSRPKAETLYDYELGFQQQDKQLSFGANLYFMNYKNQLVLTGQLNDVGANVRTNVAKSYRAGIELQAAWQIIPQLRWDANATFSQNKILNLTDFVDSWDTGEQIQQNFDRTDIAFSPNIIAASTLDWAIFKNLKTTKTLQSLNLALLSKYVGKQYLDNTSSELRQLDAYFLNDLRLSYRLEYAKTYLNVSFFAKNIFNQLYSSNGWTYRYVSNGYNPLPDDPYSTAGRNAGEYQQIGLYPQAGFNWFLALTLGF